MCRPRAADDDASDATDGDEIEAAKALERPAALIGPRTASLKNGRKRDGGSSQRRHAYRANTYQH